MGESVTDAAYHHELEVVLIVSFVPPCASSDELPKMRFVKQFVGSAFTYK